MPANVSDVGNTTANKTGAWRSFRPIVNKEKCTKCGLCVQHCPEPCIELAAAAIIDYDYCKGCLVCEQVCPFGAITHEEEEK